MEANHHQLHGIAQLWHEAGITHVAGNAVAPDVSRVAGGVPSNLIPGACSFDWTVDMTYLLAAVSPEGAECRV